ncbi:transglycosylase [Aurantiacibacter gangjinensis]|uniref:Transglycosylase n=2 Tax=Aurantiacibacter gangjinensis TaxID=502682 RepID=A0A0G9MMB4_9SPHN|nr:lytic transglycosylase domain-containing protein [Aurantiacibacter gangjinensis]KLE31830.1 transglycosylase [Aurantiacibacter gangjinensis]
MAAICAPAAQADVLQIAPSGEAQWVSGPSAGAVPAADGVAVPLGDVPAETQVLIPVEIVGDTQAHASTVPQAYAAYVAQLAVDYDLSPALIEALVWQESRWRADAISPAGARGLAQLMPGTARDLGVDPDNPYANLEGGARYLRAQLDRFDGDLELALAAYNAGPNRVARLGRVPEIRETQAYVAAIMGRLSDHSRSSD